jgi:hypothetical protein
MNITSQTTEGLVSWHIVAKVSVAVFGSFFAFVVFVYYVWKPSRRKGGWVSNNFGYFHGTKEATELFP